MLKGILRGAISFAVGVVIAVLLLVVSYAIIPNEKIQERLAVDWPSLSDNWGVQPYPHVPNGATDQITDYHMLAIAAYDGYGDPVSAAMQNSFEVDKEGILQINHLKATLHLAEIDHTASYTRYWHGYLVPLKLELFLMGYYSILFYNAGLMLGLVVAVAIMLYKRGMGRLIPILLLAIMLSGPVNITMTMEHYACPYVMLVSLILVLALGKRLDPIIGTFFLGIGMVVNYLDFLTFPIVTLTIPLLVYALLPHDDEYRPTIQRICLACACWAVGYGGMWVAKWAVGSILLHQNLFTDALSQAAVRSSSNIGHLMNEPQGNLSYLDVVKANMSNLVGTYPAMACVALAILWAIITTLYRRRSLHDDYARLRTAVPAILAGIALPFFWAAALKNHTYMHAYFTFRTFTPCIVSTLCLLVPSVAAPEEFDSKPENARHFPQHQEKD